MKKVPLVVQSYQDNKGSVELMYIHTRNKYYLSENIDVKIINFKAKEDYTIDGIKVLTLKNYKKEQEK